MYVWDGFLPIIAGLPGDEVFDQEKEGGKGKGLAMKQEKAVGKAKMESGAGKEFESIKQKGDKVK